MNKSTITLILISCAAYPFVRAAQAAPSPSHGENWCMADLEGVARLLAEAAGRDWRIRKSSFFDFQWAGSSFVRDGSHGAYCVLPFGLDNPTHVRRSRC
jgi:hypothetical protein